MVNLTLKVFILTIATVSILGFLSCSTVERTEVINLEDMPLEQAFAHWKRQYAKVDLSEVESTIRFESFKLNHALVRNNNLNLNSSVMLKLNQFADLSQEGYSNELSVNKAENAQSANVYHANTFSEVPDSINWVKKGAVTMVKNAGITANSALLATADTLEGASYVNQKKTTILSAGELVDCIPEGTPQEIFNFTAESGIESVCIYPGPKGSCKTSPAWTFYRNEGVKTVAVNDNDALKEAVAQQPVLVLIDGGNPAFQFYSSGVIKAVNCTQTVNHAVVIVGYDQENGTDYWLVKNSWGASWGDNGYAKIERASGQQPGACGIAAWAVFPYGLKKKGSPDLGDGCESTSKFLSI